MTFAQFWCWLTTRHSETFRIEAGRLRMHCDHCQYSSKGWKVV